MRVNDYYAFELTPGLYNPIEQRMLVSATLEAAPPDCRPLSSGADMSCSPETTLVQTDQSFSSQINALRQDPLETVGIETSPDLYLVTANSAVPVADSIRGFYEEQGEPVPQIEVIHADKRQSVRYFIDKNTVNNFKAEVDRLRSKIGEVKHACVVDQYVASGRTIRYAAAILESLGIVNLSAIRGDWYANVNPRDIDFVAISSTHAKFMHNVGRQAAQAALFAA